MTCRVINRNGLGTGNPARRCREPPGTARRTPLTARGPPASEDLSCPPLPIQAQAPARALAT